MYQKHLGAVDFDPENLNGLRARVSAETKGEYVAFRNALVPDFSKVWRELALGYLALIVIVAGVGMIGWIALPLGALLIGFAIAYLQLFMHEAAHYGIARDRKTNDRIANWLICWQVGTDISSYRATHWEHHRSLGTSRDTEVSYWNSLTIRYVGAMLTGIQAARVFLTRDQAATRSSGAKLWPLLRGVATHGLIVGSLVAVGWWSAATAWIVGMGIFFPFFATLRPLLEHRPVAPTNSTAAITRIFGSDIFSCTFGGAGFNRHLLHHLEPQVSYTRLPDLEEFLLGTTARNELDARRNTYWGTFAELFKSDRHG